MDQNQPAPRRSARISEIQQRAARRAAGEEAETEAAITAARRPTRRRARAAPKAVTGRATKAPAKRRARGRARERAKQSTNQPATQPTQPSHQPAAVQAQTPDPRARSPNIPEEDPQDKQSQEIRKRQRGPTKHWRRTMRWPPELSRQRGLPEGPDAPDVGPLPFLEIKLLAGPTLSGVEGPKPELHDLPSGWTAHEEDLSEGPIGYCIGRSTRDDLYDERAVEYLEKWDCFLDDSPDSTLGPVYDEKELCQNLFESECILPEGTLFDPGVGFNYIVNRAKSLSEVAMLQLTGDLIVPNAEIAVCFSEVTPTKFRDSISEPWEYAVPFSEQSARLPHRYILKMKSLGHVLPLPQPDHTVGFHELAFTPRQRSKMAPYWYNNNYEKGRMRISPFEGPPIVFFPFLTAEIKRHPLSIEIAERQNAHSMAIAMKGIVGLFKRVDPKNKPKELHRKVLGFSIAQNHERVRIHAHYPMTKGGKTTYHRWLVGDCKWTSEEDKWTAYKFVVSVYHSWVPSHLERLRSAVDALPDPQHINRRPTRRVDGTNDPAVPDPDVPDVDMELLASLSDDHRQALAEAGLIRTPDGSDVPPLSQMPE